MSSIEIKKDVIVKVEEGCPVYLRYKKRIIVSQLYLCLIYNSTDDSYIPNMDGVSGVNSLKFYEDGTLSYTYSIYGDFSGGSIPIPILKTFGPYNGTREYAQECEPASKKFDIKILFIIIIFIISKLINKKK